ncbi:MAG: hydrogenase iron-sulfur subunit [Desulfobacterales bacterium]|nr:hydrogenase iron-sulfur subunit [Desulfobacterales bacterium]
MTQTMDTQMVQISVSTDVLVVGGGYAGLVTALEIADAGYPVILVANGGAVEDNDSATLTGVDDAGKEALGRLVQRVAAESRVEVMLETRLAGAAGVAGDFTVWLAGKEEVSERKVGAVVVAGSLEIRVLNEAYGLTLSETVVSQSRFEALLADKPGSLAGKTVAFVVGFGQEGNPLVMERVLSAVSAAADVEDCTVYVYVNNIKVAEDGLERFYLQGRDKGAIYFKLTQMPLVSQTEDALAVGFTDPVLRRAMELVPDMIVVEEAIVASSDNPALADLLRIKQGAADFLQTENVHNYPVRSNREGVFVVGASRGVGRLGGALTDAGNAALAVRGLLGDGTVTVPADQAVVDEGKCTICLTCYRCCPHGAIYWESDKAVISPVACQGCGICASECPMDAIQIGRYTDTAMNGQVRERLAEGDDDLKIVAFCCQNSALEAGVMADTFNMPLPVGLKTIQVPCAGKIDIEYIMNAFTEGADGVLVLACHFGNCKSEQGNTFASWRVEDAQRMLAAAGLEKERLCFATLASNMGSDFSSIAMDLSARLKELGPSPAK